MAPTLNYRQNKQLIPFLRFFIRFLFFFLSKVEHFVQKKEQAGWVLEETKKNWKFDIKLQILASKECKENQGYVW